MKVTKKALKQRFPIPFSKRLTYYRGERSQRELADEVGLSHSTIALLERGRSNPSFDALKRFAVVFDVTVSELAGDALYGA